MNDETETPENVDNAPVENVTSETENVDNILAENVSSDNDRLTMLEIRVDHLLHSEEHKRMCVENHG